MARIVVVAFAIVLLSSCTISLTARLFNGTGAPITILVERKGEPSEQHDLKAGRSVDLKHWDWIKRVEIWSGTNSWCYGATVEPPMTFQAFPGWFVWVKRVARVRLDSSGQVVVLTPDQSENDPAPEQPQGFPIAPSDCKI